MTEQELRTLIKRIDEILADADPDAMDPADVGSLETYDYITAIQAARQLIRVELR